MIDFLKQYGRRSLILKSLALWYNSKRPGYLPDWDGIISADKESWDAAVRRAKNGPPVLVATSTGGNRPTMTLESLLSAALVLRGADVHFLLCDKQLAGCLQCTTWFYPDQKQFVKYGPRKDQCNSCFHPGDAMYRAFGLPVHHYSEFLMEEDRQKIDTLSAGTPYEEIGKYSLDGIAVGEHALAGALRFFARGDMETERYAGPVLRRYFKAALTTAFMAGKLLKEIPFETAVFHHGIYVPQGLIGEVCRSMKVKVVNWNAAYRKSCFIFSHGDTYHHTLMTEPVSKWENIHWNKLMETELMDYLKSRWYGTRDWIWFHEKPEEDLASIAGGLGVDFSRPCIGMLTNVIWDAQLHYPANAFSDMLDWMMKTIDYFIKRPELQLLIRVHPAEIRGTVPSRQFVADEIKKVYPQLPKNIFVIPPESNVSTYAAMTPCNAVIIYGTKTGVELASMGIPVIVAGEAWVRNKGITMDASSPEDYFRLLDRLPFTQPVDEAAVQRGRKYAYHFFFRRMIPVEHIEPAGDGSICKIQLNGLDDLMPGRSKGLDIICDGILKGSDFIYPAERYMQ